MIKYLASISTIMTIRIHAVEHTADSLNEVENAIMIPKMIAEVDCSRTHNGKPTDYYKPIQKKHVKLPIPQYDRFGEFSFTSYPKKGVRSSTN